MRILLSGGGTGGHIYPALSIAAALRSLPLAEPVEFTYIGTARGIDRPLVEREGISFHAVQSAGVRGLSPLAAASGILRILIGAAQAWWLLHRLRPQAVLATGGYSSIPVGLAAWLRRIPIVVYLPDVEPGWAVRILARLAWRVATTSERSLAHLPPGRGVATGYPVRPAFSTATRSEGRRHLGLQSDSRVLLIAGGSQGGHSINRAVADALPSLLSLCEIVHVSGRSDLPWLQQLKDNLGGEGERYHLHDYLHGDDMALAMAAADLAVLRAGASTLGELTTTGLPAILVPYPYSGAHQRHNARYLADAGAAVVLDDADLGRLSSLVSELMSDNQRLARMAAAARRLAQPDAARNIASLVVAAAGATLSPIRAQTLTGGAA